MIERKSGMQDRYSYGIGEWYGRSFVHLTPEERLTYAELQLQPKRERADQPCLPRSTPRATVLCTKEGGVCSIRLYKQGGATGQVGVAPNEAGILCTTCPYRFYEAGRVFRWIGEQILGHGDPLVIGQVGFLEREDGRVVADSEQSGPDDVGRIDHVLVHPHTTVLSWCALEMQAVYFSGGSMKRDFRMILDWTDPGLPFPAARRRLDYRSSGPKRLMPQLQIKVPTLRRWGKKMCVLVDQSFYGALAPMDTVADLSNCDIAWFVVGYDEREGAASLVTRFVHFTTLERAVEGLTAGRAVSLSVFEERIRAKLERESAL